MEYPRKATIEKLQSLGARHLSSDQFEKEGTMHTIEYVVLEQPPIFRVWKKTDEGLYSLHLRSDNLEKLNP